MKRIVWFLLGMLFAVAFCENANAQTADTTGIEVVADATTCERILRPNTRGEYAGVIVCGAVQVREPTAEQLAPLLKCLGERAPYGLRRMIGWKWYAVIELVMYPLPTDQIVLGYTHFPRSEVYVRAAFPPDAEFTPEQVWLHEAAHVLTHAMDDDPILPYCTGIPSPKKPGGR